MDQNPEKNQLEEPTSLEAPSTLSEQSPPAGSGQSSASQSTQPQPLDNASLPTDSAPKKTKPKLFTKFKALNVYLLIFIVLTLLAIAISLFAYQRSRQDNNQGDRSSQALDEDVLNQLRNTDVRVGDPKTVLTIEANAVFAGSALVKGSLEVAGQFRSEGPINASAINIGGTGTFQTLQTNNLQVAGNGDIQGNLNIQNSLSVAGSGSFGGTLTAGKLNVQSLEIAGDLTFGRHINPNGPNPSKSDGNALGGGGTSSVNGTDTAGTVTINTGSNPGPGCFITVNFTQSFNATPHVVITPVGAPAAGINYYINRSASNFSICTISPAPAGQNFHFDYIVID